MTSVSDRASNARDTTRPLDVAVLLATFNGERYVGPQIRSLRENTTSFTLHWLDDHSTDDTRNAVRQAALEAGVPLREWHKPERAGVPGTFFHLLESVEADVYLFCDQDDIWQPGKIDATVATLAPDAASPVICFSDPLMFYEDEPTKFQRLSVVLDMKPPAAVQPSRALMTNPAAGQSVGLTRPLRDLYISHKEIAWSHAFMHSWWMYLIASASGTTRLMSDAPTTLYRQHGNNVTTPFYARNRRLLEYLASTWQLQRRWRQGMSRQAKGFILASATLVPGPQLDRLLAHAKLVALLDQRQSVASIIRLARSGAMWPSWRRMLWLSASCIWSDARP